MSSARRWLDLPVLSAMLAMGVANAPSAARPPPGPDNRRAAARHVLPAPPLRRRGAPAGSGGLGGAGVGWRRRRSWRNKDDDLGPDLVTAAVESSSSQRVQTRSGAGDPGREEATLSDDEKGVGVA